MSDESKDVMITVRVDRSLKSKMDDHPEINWSAVSRKAIRGTIEDLEVMDEIASKNRMTETDAEEIAAQITKSANERARAVHQNEAVEDRANEQATSDHSLLGVALETGQSPSDDKGNTTTSRETETDTDE